MMQPGYKRLRRSRPLLILAISQSCSQSVTERSPPDFFFTFLPIRQYSFQYFMSFRYSEINKQGWVTSPVIIFSYFCTERFKNETWVLIIAAEKNISRYKKLMYKKYSISHFQFPISISHSPFPIPHPHSSFQ